MSDRPPLTVKQAAARLLISPALVYALCARGKIRHERHGLGRGTIRIPEDAIAEYRDRCTVGAARPAPAAVPARPHAATPPGRRLTL